MSVFCPDTKESLSSQGTATRSANTPFLIGTRHTGGSPGNGRQYPVSWPRAGRPSCLPQGHPKALEHVRTQTLLFSPKRAPGFQQPSCSRLQTQEVQLGAELLQRREPAWGPLRRQSSQGLWDGRAQGRGGSEVLR